MVLSALCCNATGQDKINTVYTRLTNIVQCHKSKVTEQNYYCLSYTGKLEGLSNCNIGGHIPAAYCIYATNLNKNTVVPVGRVNKNGSITIDKQVTTYYNNLTFCSETRTVDTCGLKTECDSYKTVKCPSTDYSNCVWIGNSKQYRCRLNIQESCIKSWTDNLVCLYDCDIKGCDDARACLEEHNNCYGCWYLPYPCYTRCTWKDVEHYQIQSLAFTYSDIFGHCQYQCCDISEPVSNAASQIRNCYVHPQKYIGYSNGITYCYGGECEINCIAYLQPFYMARICRVIDVYNVYTCSNSKDDIYYINMKIGK